MGTAIPKPVLSTAAFQRKALTKLGRAFQTNAYWQFGKMAYCRHAN